MKAQRLALILITNLLFFLSTQEVLASNQFITIVNPVRISKYNPVPEKSLLSEYSQVKSYDLPATWLLTYDVIENENLSSILSSFDPKQELGIFLEVTKNFSDNAKVNYNDGGFWHHANSVFLSGYTQKERIALIDTVFAKFKSRFGYYPTSVGSWWTDAFSMQYLKEKYSITANLGVSDQFSTDGYQVWGQPWGKPFFPSKFHPAIPAYGENKIKILNMQWAPRDPLNGYQSSLYSTQDYLVDPARLLDTSYFEWLVELYSQSHKNQYGHVVVGLEGDLYPPESYSGEYKNQLQTVSELIKNAKARALTMKDFSEWYTSNFEENPPNFIETKDPLGQNIHVFWYSSNKFRIGMSHKEDKLNIFDFRSYHPDIVDPYYNFPNGEFTLSINIPSHIDTINNPKELWQIEIGEFKNTSKNNQNIIIIEFENGSVILSENKIVLNANNITPPISPDNQTLEIKGGENSLEVTPKESWLIGPKGFIFKDLTLEATHTLKSKKLATAIMAPLIFVFVITLKLKTNNKLKILILVSIITLPYLGLKYYKEKNQDSYFVSQSEIDTLTRLSKLPGGRVLVYDKECLQCQWESKQRPAVFANKRGYVKKFSKKDTVYNLTVFSARNQEEAKKEFDKLKADYIYLTKYGDYIEKTPFSPGDLGIEKIYSNANSELWRKTVNN